MGGSRRDFCIRTAHTGDVAQILECLSEAFAPYRRAYTKPAFAATVLTPRSLARRMRSMTVLVAESRPGRLVGTVSWKRVSSRHAHLRGMAVRPSSQGLGLASHLLRATVRRARIAGFRTMTLETTEPLTQAAEVYVHLGFRRTGRTRRWGGMRLIEFERDLTPPRGRSQRIRRRAG